VNRRKRWIDLKPHFRPDRGTWEIAVPPSLAGGKRFRPSFPDLATAEKWLAEKNLEYAQGKVVTLTTQPDSSALLAGELFRLYMAEKERSNSVRAYRTLRNRLEKFRDHFQRRPADLSPWEVKKWIDSLDLSQRSKFGVWSECRSLYRWAVRYRILRENPFDQMEPLQKGRGDIEILTPDQMRQVLLQEMPDFLRAWIVLGGFAGLRTIEAQRIQWDAIKLADRQIFVGSKVIKQTSGMRHRYVEILPVLRRHLPARSQGPVVPVTVKAFRIAQRKLCASLGFPRWPQNCLRHSFASYHLANWQDAPKTAHEMGHTSPQLVHSTYAEAVTKKAARQWWAL
jgi:integrase